MGLNIYPSVEHCTSKNELFISDPVIQFNITFPSFKTPSIDSQLTGKEQLIVMGAGVLAQVEG